MKELSLRGIFLELHDTCTHTNWRITTKYAKQMTTFSYIAVNWLYLDWTLELYHPLMITIQSTICETDNYCEQITSLCPVAMNNSKLVRACGHDENHECMELHSSVLMILHQIKLEYLFITSAFDIKCLYFNVQYRCVHRHPKPKSYLN